MTYEEAKARLKRGYVRIEQGQAWYCCQCGQRLCMLTTQHPKGEVILLCKRCKEKILVKQS